jgi:DNA-binding NarL/FixJ family response regulator
MLRILIADDHPGVRSSIRSLVKSRNDWDVCGEATDGIEAVEKAKQLKPDIVLLDLSMPRMSGIQALPLIRKEVPESEVLIVSQHESPDIESLVAKAGAQGYVAKSEVGRALVPAIESANKRHSHRSPSGE